MNPVKRCTACQQELSLEMFRKQSRTKDGYQYECKNCTSSRAALRYAKKPEILEKNKQWQALNKPRHNEASQKYYHSLAGQINRTISRILDKMLGRASNAQIVGIPIAALADTIARQLPPHLTAADYHVRWHLELLAGCPPARLTEERAREFFHWQQIIAQESGDHNSDFGVTH